MGLFLVLLPFLLNALYLSTRPAPHSVTLRDVNKNGYFSSYDPNPIDTLLQKEGE